MLDILQLFLVSKAIAYARLDGHTKVDDRLRLVTAFNSPSIPASVFLISTRAGGLGLNLPSASNVVIFDPSWNPAHDCQAQDRAYRIGQTRDVQVYRLVTLGTIEEMIYVRQIYKQQLSDTTLKGAQAPRYFDGVQGDRRQQGELFGVRNLLCYKPGGMLRGIQDAYARGPDGLVVQENQVDYARAAAAAAALDRPKRKASRQAADEEMLEVADELVRNIVTPDAEGDDGGGATAAALEEPAGTSDSDSDSDHEDTEGQLLRGGGARTLLHEAIVGEHHRSLPRVAVSDSESEGDVAGLEPEPEEQALSLRPPKPPLRHVYLPKYL
ncbi:hypothetical protein PybrP1_009268 [[Pythium] brassicae (nom. inval.)]|nr:hypothetical protein PybrP1_009268 [[Pythium] brassicae (nom. inval.)]